jgi:hypothetical protein
MRTPHALIALALASTIAMDLAAAQTPTDTVAVVPTTSSPVLAMDPIARAPHVAYVQDGILIHAWKSAGSWIHEPVATGAAFTTFNGADLRITPAGRAVALYIRSGTVEFAERVAGSWQPTPLDAGKINAVSLAVSPVSGEPVAMWANRPLGAGTPAEIKLARRAAGVWTTQLIDTTSAASSRTAVAVAVDLADRPVIAWSRPRGDAVAGVVLTCAMAAGPSGPFTPAPVDSAMHGTISLALDPASGRPRLAYASAGSIGGVVRYAARTAGGGWDVMTASAFQTKTTAPSLALGPGGDPYITHTEFTPIAPQTLREGPPTENVCIFVETGSVDIHHRADAEGTGPFSGVAYMGGDQGDTGNGPRALDTSSPDGPAVAWNSPGAYGFPGDNCPIFKVSFAYATPLAGVEPGPGARVALAPPWPNPIRLGAPVRVSFALAEAADVTLELHDVAGRLLAARALGRLPAGPGSFDWAPALARPGLYWLSARADGRSLAARSLVVIR